MPTQQITVTNPTRTRFDRPVTLTVEVPDGE